METSSRLLLTLLLNACWQTALLTAVAALCARMLRATAARYRHRLWVAALAISCCLPVVTSSHFSVGALFSGHARARTTGVPVIVSSEPLPQPGLPDLPAPSPAAPKEPGPLILINRNSAAAAVILYFLFLCYRSIGLFRALRMARAVRRSARPVEFPEHLRAIIEKCQTVLGVTRARILCSTSVSVPVTVGSLDPLVILPEQLLRESDADLLTSAIGHELVHVSRRDYLFNLICELAWLPLSFHPAAALVRRRIRQTRELRCDELVTDRLLEAEVYARSLVRLAGSAAAPGHPAITLAVGIADADILEERVMTMLRRSKTDVRRKNLLLLAASLLLAAPCVAAVPFALRISINSQGRGASVITPQGATQEAGQKEERARTEVVMPTLGADRETGTLVAWLKKPGEAVERGEAIARVETTRGLIEAEAFAGGVIERLLVRPGEKVPAGTALAIIREQEQPAGREISSAPQGDRGRMEFGVAFDTPRPEGRQTQDAAQEARRKAEREKAESDEGALRVIRAEAEARLRELRTKYTENHPDVIAAQAQLDKINQEIVSGQEQQEAIEKEKRGWTVTTSDGTLTLTNRQREERARAEREAEERALTPEQREERRRLEREMKARRQAELVKEARITMDQAIRMTTNLYPGTVLESRLVRERDQACYIIVVLSTNGTENTATRVLMSAIDGHVINASREER